MESDKNRELNSLTLLKKDNSSVENTTCLMENCLNNTISPKKSPRIPFEKKSLKFYYIDNAKSGNFRKRFTKTNTMTETHLNFLFSDNMRDLKHISISKMTESASCSSNYDLNHGSSNGNSRISKHSKKNKIKSQRGKQGIRRFQSLNENFKNKLFMNMNINNHQLMSNGTNFNINIINNQPLERPNENDKKLRDSQNKEMNSSQQ